MRARLRIATEDLAVVRVKTSERAEKDLAPHAERISQADELGYLLKLVTETGSWIQWKGRHQWIAHTPERAFHLQGLSHHSACAPHEGEILVFLKQLQHRAIPWVGIRGMGEPIEA